VRVGLVGLGNMGGRMAGRLLEAGHEVLGFDTVPGRAEALRAEPCDSAAAVAAGADVVLLSLPSDAAIETAMCGPGGLAEAARVGQVVADLSTANPANAARWVALLAERGADFVDAGISGGPMGADAGTLTLMAGGSAQALARLEPVFDVIGERVLHVGGPGSGHTAKVINNFLNGMNLAATAEAMVLGVKAGLEPHALLEVINASTGSNWASQNRFARIIDGDYIEGGLTNALMAKDLDLYLGLAAEREVPALLGSACRSAFAIAMAHGRRDEVSNTVVDVLGDLAGGVRIQSEDAG
jgi:3-hydroxyisobutyrate dehydrogenase